MNISNRSSPSKRLQLMLDSDGLDESDSELANKKVTEEITPWIMVKINDNSKEAHTNRLGKRPKTKLVV